ncbi:unnamed protein product [Rodentolepis nana]|uniref:C2H2-type domain-containing protein n=1 Tax=Rodentolepis nana TaxID=102285 RepID=A0A158QHY0_RODNA|nr:unnamed protein product [Rodentolepis nana]
MQPTKAPQHLSSLHPSFLPTTLANPGDILFSTTTTNRRSNSFLQPSNSSRYHQNTSVFSLVDPNIELPTISANEVEQVFNQLQSTNSSQSTSRKTTGYWLSKDDSFTPPPIKRSFGGCITPAVSCSNNPAQTQQLSQIRSSSLVAALQLPSLGSVNSNSNSSSSPPLHAALRRQLLAPLNTLTNLSSAAKQRQENLTVRLANRAKLTSAARIPVVTNGSSVESECSTPTRTVVLQQAPMVAPSSNDLHIPQDPNERFRFVCPHPRCGRRYQARIGLTRHLMKYHEESVETEENTLSLKSSASKPHQEILQSSTVASTNSCEDNTTANRLSRSPVANTNGSASSSVTSSNTSSNLKLCFSVRTVRIDHRSSQSLDRSKVQRRCPSPPPPSSSINTLTGSTLHPSRSSASGVTSIAARAALRSRTSPSLLYERPGTASGVLNSPETVASGVTNSAAKVAIVSMQHSPVATTSSNSEQLEQIPSQSKPSTSQLHTPASQLQPPQTPFNMCIYSNDVSDLLNTSGGAYTEPWCCGSSDRTAPVASLAPCSSSCCWPDDYEEFEQEKGVDEELECGVGDEADFLGEDCSSDLGFDSCYYPSRPTDSLPCLLHPTYPRHFHSPPPSFHHLPRGSALDLSSTTTGMTEECSSCCWTADSSSLGYGRGGRHSSEDGGIPPGSFWTSPYPRVPPPRQRKQMLSSTSSALLVCRRRLSTNGGEKKNGVCSGSMRLRRGGDRHGRRRTMSSSGGSSGGILVPPASHQHGMKADSVSTERSSSVICGGGCDQTSMPMSKDELVTCPVHDCGLVCSGCENLCEHLKECHLPDSQSKPVRLIFACPVKSCRTFCANEAAFEAHFDAHLENRISGKIGNYFRRTSANTASTDDYLVNGASFSSSRQPHQQSHRRHVKSTSSLVDLNMDVLDDLCLPLSMSPTAEQHVTADDEDVNNRNINDDPDFSTRTSPAKLDSPSTPVGILDGENWSLLQALDLLPDDDLHELLQGKTSGGSTNCINGAFTGPPLFNGGSGNTPTLSNGSSNGGIGGIGVILVIPSEVIYIFVKKYF